jgi:hypothetical protein
LPPRTRGGGGGGGRGKRKKQKERGGGRGGKRKNAAEQAARDGQAAPDGRLAEAALTADIRVGQHVADRSHHLCRAEQTAALLGEAADHVTQLVVARQDTTLVTEETAFAIEDATQQTAEETAVGGTDDPVHSRDRRTDVRGDRHRGGRSHAQAECDPCCRNPSYRCQWILPFPKELGLAVWFRHGANGGNRR